jgi:hypothetical protein
MSTKYLIIQSDTLDNAKTILRNLISDLGYSEYNFEYVVGQKNIGYANGTVMKNNTVLTDWGNGNFLFTFDRNIVAEFGIEIEAEVLKHTNIFWCDKVQVQEFMPTIEVL